MSRSVFPFVAKDVSSLARSLTREIEALDRKPGHVQLLNMLTRSVGYQNFQHFRAQAEAEERLGRDPATPEPVDHLRVERVARHFDAQGRLIRWPSRANHQELCLWALWARIDAGRVYSERQVGELLKMNHLFGDHALLRRALYDWRLVSRTSDGREYRRTEQRPPPDAVALVRHLDRRSHSRGATGVAAGTP